MAKSPSLKKLMENIDWGDSPKVNKYEVTESVRTYQQIGSSVFGGTGILETAKQLSKIVEDAQNHVLSENDDWFEDRESFRYPVFSIWDTRKARYKGC